MNEVWILTFHSGDHDNSSILGLYSSFEIAQTYVLDAVGWYAPRPYGKYIELYQSDSKSGDYYRIGKLKVYQTAFMPPLENKED